MPNKLKTFLIRFFFSTFKVFIIIGKQTKLVLLVVYDKNLAQMLFKTMVAVLSFVQNGRPFWQLFCPRGFLA